MLLPATCASPSGGSRTPAQAPIRWPTRQAVGRNSGTPVPLGAARWPRWDICICRGRRAGQMGRPAAHPSRWCLAAAAIARAPLLLLACFHSHFPHRRRCQVPEPRLRPVLEAGAPSPLTPLGRGGHFPSGECPPPPVRVRARRRSGGGLPVASSCRCARPGRRREAYMLLFLRTLC